MDAFLKCGLMIDLYRFKNIPLSMYVNVLKIRPTFQFALLTLLLICSVNFIFGKMLL